MEQTQPVNKIGRNFNFWQLIRFALPTLATQLFLAIFKTVDDGLFVSNFVGADALSAINVVFPVGMFMGGFALVFASGGSAVCARKMGEGKPEEALRCFSGVVVLTMITGAIMATGTLLFQKPLLRMVGATDLLMKDCIIYTLFIWGFQPFSMLSPLFDFFFGVAGKPGMSMVASVVNGAVNIIGDIIFIVVLKLGVLGAALATTIGEVSFITVGLLFYRNKKHEVHFTKPDKHLGRLLKDVFSSGMAQFFNHIAMAVSSLVSNFVMLKLANEDGIAAYSILGYLQYMMGSMLFGFCDGVAPVFSYNYGARNKERIRRHFKYCMRFLVGIGVGIVVLCFTLQEPLISLYVQKAREPELYAMVKQGINLFPYGFLFSGISMFGTRFFTSVGDGKRASILSFARNGVLNTATLILLPMAFGLTGVWLASPVGELLGFLVVGVLLIINRNNYGYGKSGTAILLDAMD